MDVPNGTYNRSLILVDLQPPFVNTNTSHILDNIMRLLETVEYQFYARIFFHCEKGSIWQKQQNYLLEKDSLANFPNFDSNCQIQKFLEPKNSVVVEKETKSAFKGKPNLDGLLKQNNIEEVHIVGIDTYDCVLATAFESFDLGYLTYVIEECCYSNNGESLNNSAIEILRDLKMTNQSCISTKNTITIASPTAQ